VGACRARHGVGRKESRVKGMSHCHESVVMLVSMMLLWDSRGRLVSEAPVHGSELMVRLILSGCPSEAVLAKKGSLMEAGRQKSVRSSRNPPILLFSLGKLVYVGTRSRPEISGSCKH
jgi:hypothetical protein